MSRFTRAYKFPPRNYLSKNKLLMKSSSSSKNYPVQQNELAKINETLKQNAEQLNKVQNKIDDVGSDIFFCSICSFAAIIIADGIFHPRR
jgi:hypothetical protein